MSFIDRVDRVLVLQEATYGFVMALTFVTASQLGLLNVGRSQLVIAILAMDFVWGIIDMVIFFDCDVIEQRQRRQMLVRLYSASDREHMRSEVYDSLEATVFDELDEDSKNKAVELVMNARMTDRKGVFADRKVYLFNAVTAFVVTFSSAIPAALCLMLISDVHDAYFIAAVVSAVALFFIGYAMANTDNTRIRVASGLSLTILTMALTLFAAYFGG